MAEITSQNPVVPRPAATLMLLRDGPGGAIETLMVVRHEQLVFGSGALVFPGGRVDRGDEEIARRLAQAGEDAAALAFAVAAVRETLEETGVLLATTADRAMVSRDVARDLVARHRAALNAGRLAFGDLMAAERLEPATGELVRFAHWITPPSRPKRFDTHFFLAAAPPGQEAVHDGTESTESVWLTPEAVFEGAASGRYKLLFATRMNLMKLAASPNVAAALEAARSSAIVPVTPETVSDEGGVRMVRVPEEAGYGGDVFASTDPPAI